VLWQGRRYPVIRVESRWRTPEGPAFCVGTGSGERFELVYREIQDRWVIRVLPNRDKTAQEKAKILPFPPQAVSAGGQPKTDEEVQF
jgi:hypothetical protein